MSHRSAQDPTMSNRIVQVCRKSHPKAHQPECCGKKYRTQDVKQRQLLVVAMHTLPFGLMRTTLC